MSRFPIKDDFYAKIYRPSRPFYKGEIVILLGGVPAIFIRYSNNMYGETCVCLPLESNEYYQAGVIANESIYFGPFYQSEEDELQKLLDTLSLMP